MIPHIFRLFALLVTPLLLSAEPTIWLVGDSTVNTPTEGQDGWGEVIGRFFKPDAATVENRAMGGRSSRTFIAEGRWDAVREKLRPGDFVLIQFGHNDGGPINDNHRARGTIRGIGDESETIDNLLTGAHETVYSFGHYLRRYVEETRAAGATPVLCSLVPRKIWEDGEIRRDRETYAGWTAAVAWETGAHFVDLNEIIALGYEAAGAERVEAFFADAHTHTTTEGALFAARAVIAGLNGLEGQPFAELLTPEAAAIPAYPEHKRPAATPGARESTE